MFPVYFYYYYCKAIIKIFLLHSLFPIITDNKALMMAIEIIYQMVLRLLDTVHVALRFYALQYIILPRMICEGNK